MHHITILSEDRVFSTLLARNLQAQGHEVDIHLLNLQLPLSFLASAASWDTSLWILDLSWFDYAKSWAYRTLAEWCGSVRRPFVLLVDDSWDARWVRVFRSRAALSKPFAMVNFLQLVNKVQNNGDRGRPVGKRTPGEVVMELRERPSTIFQKWSPVYRRLVVPLDGSRLAESILPIVVTMAEALHLEVMLLHVVPEEGEFLHAVTPYQKKAIEDVNHYLDALVADLNGHGIQSGWRVIVGDVVEGINRYALEAPADLIAMSTHGMGAADEASMGTVAAAVLDKQTRPVLLIKPDQESAW